MLEVMSAIIFVIIRLCPEAVLLCYVLVPTSSETKLMCIMFPYITVTNADCIFGVEFTSLLGLVICRRVDSRFAYYYFTNLMSHVDGCQGFQMKTFIQTDRRYLNYEKNSVWKLQSSAFSRVI